MDRCSATQAGGQTAQRHIPQRPRSQCGARHEYLARRRGPPHAHHAGSTRNGPTGRRHRLLTTRTNGHADMSTAYLAVTFTAVVANGFSGVAAMLHLKAILPAMERAGVPQSWLAFVIGHLKPVGAIWLALGRADLWSVPGAEPVGLGLV